MKIKNEKGITMISLVITVIVLVIITSVTVSIGINFSGSANFQNTQTDMLLIQTKCEYITHELAINDNPDVKKYGVEIQSGDYTGWYKLNADELADIGVIKQKSRSDKEKEKYADLYYVNYEENDVAYVKGIEFEGRMFYKLSDMIAYSNN